MSYIFSLDKVPIVAAANNYLSLFNPAGSEKIILVNGVFISSTLTTPSSVTDPLRGWRITAASGGVLQSAPGVAKTQSKLPDPTAEVRTGNPTVTLGAPVFNSPAPIENRSSSVHVVGLGAAIDPFILAPGEGLVLRSEAGAATGGTWNLSIVWAEAKLHL